MLEPNKVFAVTRSRDHHLPSPGRADYIKLILSVGGDQLRAELDKESSNVISMLRLSTEAGHWKYVTVIHPRISCRSPLIGLVTFLKHSLTIRS